MAIKVKDAASSAQKFVTRAQSAAGDYSKGVQGAGADWQQKTAGAAEAYAGGVQAAIANGRFAKGVQQAGGAKYEKNASTKGAQRYPQGVAAAGPDWQAATGKFLDTIAGLSLPPRRPKGDPANYQRSQMVGDALRKAKMGN